MNDVQFAGTTHTYYAGNYIYKKGNAQGQQSVVLTFFNTEEGYVEPQFDPVKTTKIVGYNYTYQYKDHLGNIRLSYEDMNGDGVISAETEIKEENHYYPFGLKHKGYNNTIVGRDHNYGYGGKEEQRELGLEWQDFHARNYDAALGRWMNIDPLTEKYYSYSPYNYVINNPITNVDPDGMDVVLFIWLTKEGDYGHAGVAVSNYEKDKDGNYRKDKDGNYIEDGTYTYYDLYPEVEEGGGVTEATVLEAYPGDYEKVTLMMEELRDNVQSSGQDRQADGILLTETDFETDQVIKGRLNEIMKKGYNYKSIGQNCSDFCREAYEGMLQAKSPEDKEFNYMTFLPLNFGKETDSYKGQTATFTTPHQLYKDVKKIKTTYVIKDPGAAVNKSFKKALLGSKSGTKKARKKS